MIRSTTTNTTRLKTTPFRGRPRSVSSQQNKNIEQKKSQTMLYLQSRFTVAAFASVRFNQTKITKINPDLTRFQKRQFRKLRIEQKIEANLELEYFIILFTQNTQRQNR